MTKCSKRTPLTIAAIVAGTTFAFAAGAATDIVSSSFIIDPGLPTLAPDQSITGYSSVPVGSPFQLPGGAPLGPFVNDFTYPAARIGKFIFDPTDVTSLFPTVGSNNGLGGSTVAIKMAITDLDTNGGPTPDSDYLDVIFALSLTDTDDGSTLVRLLTNEDGGLSIAPQFLTGFGNQSLSAAPDIATNVYDLSGAPSVGSDLAELFSASGGEVWLYLIDTDDAGNNISLAQSLPADFAITASFEPITSIPVPPAIFLLGSAIIATASLARRKG